MSISEDDPATAPVLLLPDEEVALAGVTIPLGGISIAAAANDDVAVVITVPTGALYASTAPGAAVGGGGTSSLWLAGSLAQVNAKLATLAYAAPAAGTVPLSLRLFDASGATPGPSTIELQVLSLIGPPMPAVTLSGGTLTLADRTLEGITLDLQSGQTGAGVATLVLDGSTLGATTALVVSAATDGDPAPRVAIARHVELDGATRFDPGPALVTLAQNAILTNAGTIVFDRSTASFSGAGTLENVGTITIAAEAAPTIGSAIRGTGTILLAAGARLALAGPVAATQSIRFEPGAALLRLDAPQNLLATITGFAPGDQIQLGEIAIDGEDYSQSGNSGTLTLWNGARIAATLHFAGVYQLSDFLLSAKTDSASDDGAITTLTVRSPAATLAYPSATSDIYRFFDTVAGTQFLTQDPGERELIGATRPDLKFEGVAMHSFAASDPAGLAVYRFFDVADGTHFFTASATEKDSVLATRPDLVLEPGSTIWEHATQQAGDTPVYRFFDSGTGTHFFTADAVERASILATRPDLRPEGVAFYAPSQ